MKTACYETFTGPGRICIARWHPRGTPKGFRCFKALAPGDWFKKVERKEFLARYAEEILGVLDPQQTYDKLVELADGTEPVLLCWEYPPFGPAATGHFCHRVLVAKWFKRTLGIVVPEVSWPELVKAEQEMAAALGQVREAEARLGLPPMSMKELRARARRLAL